MEKTIKSVLANLTFTVGQLEELKSNVNDTMRYLKNNQDKWATKNEADSKNESKEDEVETAN